MGRRKSILTIINEAENDQSTSVDVFPLMCGSGKSTAISEKIAESIRKKEGLLIVTDRKNRFKQYLEPRSDVLREYIQKNASKIACLTAETAYKVNQFESERIILMMTTQRFFRLTKEQLEKYMSWGTDKRRKLILFDEQPSLFFQTQIDISTINQFEEIFVSLVNTIPDAEKRIELIHWWNSKKLSFLTRTSLAENCSCDRDNFFTMIPPENKPGDENGDYDISEEYSVLDDVISQRKKTPRDSKCDPYELIRGLKLFGKYGAIYGYRSIRTGKYESLIMPTQSEEQKMAHNGAKVIILDGTADLSLAYNNQSYIRKRKEECEPYIRKIPNLHIILVKDKTSKTTMVSQSMRSIRRFQKYIQNDSHCSKVYIFSHKQIVMAIREAEKEEATPDTSELIVKWDYFGNTNGRNDFQDFNVFGQVGLFTRPESYYLAKIIEQYPEIRQQFNQYVNSPETYEESYRIISDIKESQGYKELKYKDILADIEQNVFRSPVRSEEYEGEVRYYLFFDYVQHELLSNLIYERFHGRYGAEVLYHDPFGDFELEKTKNRKTKDGQKSHAQLILEYIDSLEDGTVFSKEDLRKNTGLSDRQISSARQNNAPLRAAFVRWTIKGQSGKYRKK